MTDEKRMHVQIKANFLRKTMIGAKQEGIIGKSLSLSETPAQVIGNTEEITFLPHRQPAQMPLHKQRRCINIINKLI